jgi:predicted transcriptional regulator
MALPEKTIGANYGWLTTVGRELLTKQEAKAKPAAKPVASDPPPTVEAQPSSTVEAPSPSTVESLPSSTVELAPSSTVDDTLPATVEDDELWRAEGAPGFFSSSRIRRITDAQQALTHVEEAVYDVLWGPKKKGELETCRLAQVGYAELAAKSRVSKRTIQSIIDRLLEKRFIRIEKPADIMRRAPTVYRVFSYAAMRKHQRDTGRNWVVRTGKGVFYARRSSSTVEARPSATVEALPAATVEARSTSTVADRSSSTVARTSSSTVEAASTPKREGTAATGTSSSEAAAVQQALARYGPADDDAVLRLMAACRQAAQGATGEEIAHFVQVKGEQLRARRDIQNPIGMLLRSVPRCFDSKMLMDYRRDRQGREAEARRQAQAVLDDPEASSQEREWAATVLAAAPGAQP